MTAKDKARLRVLAERDKILSAMALEQLARSRRALVSGKWAPIGSLSNLDVLLFSVRSEMQMILDKDNKDAA